MRDSKRLMAVGMLLAAMPAWASDMCGLGGLVMLPPVYVWIFIAGIIGLAVRTPRSARIALAVLVVGGLPSLGTAVLCLSASFHDAELKHPTMFTWAVGALFLLTASHVWAFWRLLLRVSKQEGSGAVPPTADS
ncbi:hypothetical protein [Corallococcus carmarthensis]|uniref:Uncharacterized protein n=1 Tax=Corallococcus carmarthensis TaxID=2316728 RepID=A0A3A8KJM5_9BACT|nr:hypothetical protein [Corallococcus carmarthensis]RKH02622.1 hypothetical protein D7X32_16270 [Corallococcus carmarthensis]